MVTVVSQCVCVRAHMYVVHTRSCFSAFTSPRHAGVVNPILPAPRESRTRAMLSSKLCHWRTGQNRFFSFTGQGCPKGHAPMMICKGRGQPTAAHGQVWLL